MKQFPTTHWSEVARAGDADPQVKRDALGRLLTSYMPALRAHLLGRKRIPSDRADDLLQGFVCDQVVANDLIAGADREKGRFRTFVLVALDRHVARVGRADGAAKRNPDAPVLSLDDHEEPAGNGGDAADAFDLAWAREVVQRAIRQMRETCRARGEAQEQIWLIFESCALAPLFDGTDSPSHQHTMERFALASPQQVSNLLVTGKRTFARNLRSVVGEYLRDGDEIEAELMELWTILSRNGTTKPTPGHTIG